MPQGEAWTVGRLIEWTTDYLRQQGCESPRLDAEILLAEARGCQRIDLYTQFDVAADPPVRAAFRELVRRRAEGTPVAYLVGRREFFSLSFRVTPDVLIPRPETEFVVVTLLDLVRSRPASPEPLEIADVGTGSGVLAVCAACEIAEARITAIDISEAALEVARTNAVDHGVADRIEFVSGDLFGGIPLEKQFDFIVSNPPYVSHAELQKLATEVKDHEPQVALNGGPDGTALIGRLIQQASQRLHADGWLIFEISPMVAAKATQMLQENSDFVDVSTVNDLAGLPRVARARKKRSTSRDYLRSSHTSP